MLDLALPKIECERAAETYARFRIEPLEPGYGYTMGNALRRVLLSSIPGAAITRIKIDGVYHEFATVPGVREDVTEIVLNVKGIRLRSTARLCSPAKPSKPPCACWLVSMLDAIWVIAALPLVFGARSMRSPATSFPRSSRTELIGHNLSTSRCSSG